jgi:hypothetical protein
MAPWRNDGCDSRVVKPFDQGVCIVPFVAEQRAASDAFEQLPRDANIVDVTRRQNQSDRIAQGGRERMSLGSQAASGASDGLVLAV